MKTHASTGRKAILVGGILAVLASSRTMATSILTVDGSNPACNDAGTGTPAAPLCTIQAAANQALPGDMVSVNPGTYREQVTPKFSGMPGSPIIYRSAAGGVVVRGSADVSDPALWAPTATTAWSMSLASVTRQVMVDGVRLSAATSATTMTLNSFFYDAVAKVLYVDLGGANPGQGHTIEASVRSYAFNLAGVTDIALDGFTADAQNTASIRLFNASNALVRNIMVRNSASYGIKVEASLGPVSVEGCNVSFSGSNGILILNNSGATVRGNTSSANGFHGISLQGSSNNQVIGNLCFGNSKPNVRSATGIDINAISNDNLIQSNTTYGNQDSGIQVYNGSSNNLVTRNVSYNNGDHGFDTNKSTGTRYVSNTSYGNYKDGFSVEGSSTGTFLANNISMNNGLTTNEFDLYVDTLSTNGFFSDFDLFFNSAAGMPVKFNGTLFASIADFTAATTFESHGMAVDPMFVDAASGDFRLNTTSPAANQAYCDDCGASSTSLTGATVSMMAVPSSGVLNLPVTVSATTGNIDPARVAGYTFNFGDGTVYSLQPSSVANHTFTNRGVFVITTTACDIDGRCFSDSNLVSVFDNPPASQISLSDLTVWTGTTVQADASASTDTDGAPIATYSFNFGDGFVVGPQSSPLTSHKYTTAGVYNVVVTVTDTLGVSSTATSSITVFQDKAPTAVLKLNPAKTAKVKQVITADASASTDPDLAPIATYTFNFEDGTVIGPQASPVASHAFAKQGNYNVKVTVTDTAGLSSSDTLRIQIKK